MTVTANDNNNEANGTRDTAAARVVDPFHQKEMFLRNRFVMSPMCMYSVPKEDGVPNDWHMVHLGARAVGGAGLVIAEATAVEPVGRLSEQDCGLWNQQQADAYAEVARFCKKHGAAFGIQLAHGGRKAWSDRRGHPRTLQGGERDEANVPIGPSALVYGEGWCTPRVMTVEDIDRVVQAFGDAAKRARETVDCDMVEIHAAHGYLLHNFLSPLSNNRTDEYGGSLQNRAQFLHRVYRTVRENFGEDRPVWVRISCTDWVDSEPAWTIDESVELAKMMREWGVDLVDCSSGGNSEKQKGSLFGSIKPGYQVPFSERIRREANIPTGAVGLITDAHYADEIVRSGKADVVLLGRELLRNPQFPLHALNELLQETEEERGEYPRQYFGRKIWRT